MLLDRIKTTKIFTVNLICDNRRSLKLNIYVSLLTMYSKTKVRHELVWIMSWSVTTLACLKVFNKDASLIAVNGVPSSAFNAISFSATTCPVCLVVNKTMNKNIGLVRGWQAFELGGPHPVLTRFQRATTIPADKKRNVFAKNSCLLSAELMSKTKKKKNKKGFRQEMRSFRRFIGAYLSLKKKKGSGPDDNKR